MKKVLMVVAVLLFKYSGAQTQEEFFDQKKTQLRYLAEQIAALKEYARYVGQGYEIAQQGLQVVDDLKKGEFSLHKRYFDNLNIVKPQISGYWKVAAIMLSSVRIAQACRLAHVNIRSGAFTTEERKYLNNVCLRVLREIDGVLADLKSVLATGNMQLSDEGRLVIIDNLFQSMLAHQKFSTDLLFESKGMAAMRRLDSAEGKWVGKLYGVK
jgi:hypothetical protein